MHTLLLLLHTALAADPAPRTYTIAEIQILDEAGDWTATPSTGEAYRVGPDGDVPLQTGEVLPGEAHIVTQEARLVIDGPGTWTFTVYDGTDITLKDWGVWQEFGAVLYDVHGVFAVRYAHFEALVEGTRFVVEGTRAGTGSVAVSRGKVRVRDLQGEVLVRRGHLAKLEPGAPPEKRRWRPTAPRHPGIGSLAKAARPKVVLGAEMSGRYGLGDQTANGGSGELAARAALRLPGPFAVVGQLGLNSAGDQGHFPLAVGVDWHFGPVSVGGSGQLSMGLTRDCDTGEIKPQIAGGGAVDLGYHLALGEHLELAGRVSGGWLYGPELKFGVGLGVAL